MDIQLVECDDARQLLDHLRLGHSIWRESRFGDIAFRGQAKSEWKLVPVAFREETRFGYMGKVFEGPISDPQTQAEAEYTAVAEFIKLADTVGLPVPGDSQQLRNSNTQNGLFEEWPADEILETLAIAQHHGVPTRLLDFTYDPLTAAFHAAMDVIQLGLIPDGEAGQMGCFAIWGIDLRFVRLAWEYPPRGTDRVREVTVPRASNPYLHAQNGLFLVDNQANGADSAIENAVCDRAVHWEHRTGFWPSSNPASRLLPPVLKLTIPWSQALDVIRYLHHEGKTLAHLTPSYDGVVTALKLIRDLGVYNA